MSFAKKLNFCLRKIYISTQKINSSRFEIFEIVIDSFLVDDKNRKSRFFKKDFLLVDITIDIAFGILYFSLSNIKINFNNDKFRLRLYIITEDQLTIKWFEVPRKKSL